MKNKTKTILPLIMMLSLFLSGINVNSETTISDVNYPDTVRKGDTFDIVIAFDYATDVDCLYGPRIFITYIVTYDSLSRLDWDYTTRQEPALDDTTGGIALGKPATMTISIDTSELDLADIEDYLLTFKFQIQYDQGFIYYVGGVEQVSKVGTVFTSWYELTITNDLFSTMELIYIYSGSALAGLLLIGLTVYLVKRRK